MANIPDEKRVEVCSSKPQTEQEIRAKRTKERAKFEKWFRKYWGGIPLTTVTLGRHSFEYKESAAQTAWEVWAKFCEVTL